jgi:hypothetical protein
MKFYRDRLPQGRARVSPPLLPMPWREGRRLNGARAWRFPGPTHGKCDNSLAVYHEHDVSSIDCSIERLQWRMSLLRRRHRIYGHMKQVVESGVGAASGHAPPRLLSLTAHH